MKKRVRGVVCAVALVAILAVIVAGIKLQKETRNGQELNKQNMNIQAHHIEAFGDNVYFFTPEDDPQEVQALLESVYRVQETNQFGDARYAFYFLPGEYDEQIQPEVGYYTQVAGLGMYPTQTKIAGLSSLARWLGDDSNHNATCNFWRGVENIEIQSDVVWAVSQATEARRLVVDGNLYLHDENGWASGGFHSDSRILGIVDSGSQQQWLSRNNAYEAWTGENWNLVFVGEKGDAPTEGWPAHPYTAVDVTPQVREKPFLVYDEANGFGVYVPRLRENAIGTSWEAAAESGAEIPWISADSSVQMAAVNATENGGESGAVTSKGALSSADQNLTATQDVILGIDNFYIARAEVDTAQTINEALAEGKSLLLTPGIYELTEPIRVERENAIVLGMGLATLRSKGGASCMEVADASGIEICGILFDAGETKSEHLLHVAKGAQEKTVPILLSDLFFRVGGTNTEQPTTTKNCITIDADHVIGDNFWVWRADHGDQVAWDKNVCENGIIVNGDNVTIYGLMVEHFNEYQTIWNGNHGRIYMYQSEIPYDVPDKRLWMSHDGYMYGYASIYVAPEVEDFYATGLGIYLYNRDAVAPLHCAVEMPDKDGVRIENICTVMLTGNPGMERIINDSGYSVFNAGQRQILLCYENGIFE